MKLPERLYKTTIVIWSEYDGGAVELSDLAREADQGDAYCSRQESELVTNPADFPDTEFFGVEDNEGDNEPQEPGSPAGPDDAISSVLGAMGASDETRQRIRRTLGGDAS